MSNKVFFGLLVICAACSEILCVTANNEKSLKKNNLETLRTDRVERSLVKETENKSESKLPAVGETDSVGETLDDIDNENLNKEEVANAEELPQAEKFIGAFRKKHPQDLIREKMIGMIFTGRPEPLGPRAERRSPPSRRIFRARPVVRNDLSPPRMRYEMPKEILKPMPFIPRPSVVEFTSTRLAHSASTRPKDFVRGPPPPVPPPSQYRPKKRIIHEPPKRFAPNHDHGRMSIPKDIFSNTLGPDFGPVTFEDFGSNFENQVNDYVPEDTVKKAIKPSPYEPTKPIYHSTKTMRPPITSFDFTDTKLDKIEDFKKIDHSFSFGNKHKEIETCQRYTEDICLNADNYPHQEILKSLSLNPSRAKTLMAEVREQSADDLVDGLTAAQEARYDFTHYYGNRRGDNLRSSHRDFAEDGGYLCPSEVKYARPKRARNSKGEWKFIVNMDKYSQTIRMEKCMKAGGTCSYVSHHYRATCNQIYNYQRLLSWEKERGLHMDIYKVPSCCSCHIEGYSYVFPPLKKGKDHQFSGSERMGNFVPIDPNSLEDVNRKAPPYSPVNYPNVSPVPEDRSPSERKRQSNRYRTTNAHQQWKPRRRNFGSKDSSTKRIENPRHRVNYDYHPIIDFFEVST